MIMGRKNQIFTQVNRRGETSLWDVVTGPETHDDKVSGSGKIKGQQIKGSARGCRITG